MTLSPWRILGSRTVFATPRIAIEEQAVQLPDGRVVDDFQRVTMADFALVFATTDDDRVLMLRSYKHGPERVCLTFPGGAVSTGEAPSAAIRREMLEETGYEAASWESLGSYVTNANQRCNVAHLFRARGCRRIMEANPGDLEQMELVLMGVESLLRRDRLAEVGLASHLALLLLATHPALQ